MKLSDLLRRHAFLTKLIVDLAKERKRVGQQIKRIERRDVAGKEKV